MTITLFGPTPDDRATDIIAALRATGTGVRVVWSATADPAPRHGTHPDDIVAADPKAQSHAWQRAAGTDVLLLGGVPGGADALRRATAAGKARSLHLWTDRADAVAEGSRSRKVRATWRRGLAASWRIDGIFAAGTRAAKSYAGVAGADTPVHVLPFVTAADVDPSSADRALPSAGGPPVFGLVQPARYLAGLATVLAALEHGAGAWRVELVGAGPAARALVTRSAAAAWVTIVDANDVADASPAPAHWSAQLVPYAATDHPWDLAIQRSMNSAIPVIAGAANDAVRDLVKDTRTGVVIPVERHEQAEAWAEAMQAVGDAAVSTALGRAAAEVAAELTPAIAARFLLDVLDEAARGRAGLGTRPASRSLVDNAWTAIRLRA